KAALTHGQAEQPLEELSVGGGEPSDEFLEPTDTALGGQG
ncbi:unnamed protein product, partial [marine sediment metagenome]